MRRFTNEVKSVLPEFWPDFNDSNSRMMSYVLHVLVPEVSLCSYFYFRFRPLVNDDRKCNKP